MLFEGQLQPGQLSQFEFVANLHDQIDGVIDGMARFTLRKFLEGFGGDYNNDFVTDAQDLALWQQTYGTPDFLADGNANGLVEGGDFLNWQRQHGRGFGSTGDFPQDQHWCCARASFSGIGPDRPGWARLGSAGRMPDLT